MKFKDGNKNCMFYHPKPNFKQPTPSFAGKPVSIQDIEQWSTELEVPPLPQHRENECLPKEYLDKVSNYFDNSQITNVNMI